MPLRPARSLLRLLGLVALAVMAFAATAAPPLRFFALGDLPYSEAEWPPLETMLTAVAQSDPPFIVHIGDIKRGSAPCDDATLARVAGLFRRQPMPVLYTPGDNEWTDCGRAQAGGYDPSERLAAVRRIFFADPTVLRLAELDAVQPLAGYPEDYWLLRDGVLIASIHVVGSQNNRRAGDEAATAEWRARSAANRALLQRALTAAKDVQAQALVLLFHANPTFERPGVVRGYRPLFTDLDALRRAFPGPILVIHGDTHHYRFDHPLTEPSTGAADPRFARLEVPGSPFVAGVWVTVDPAGSRPFAVEPFYPVSLDVLRGE